MRRYDEYYVVLRRRRWPLVLAMVCGVATFVVGLGLALGFWVSFLIACVLGGITYRFSGS